MSVHRPSVQVAVAAVMAALLWPGLAAAQEPDADAPPANRPWYRDVTLNGAVSVSFGVNFNHPPSGTNQFRVFDTEDSVFRLDVAELVVQRAATKPGSLGFRVDMTAGREFASVLASKNGLFRDESGEAGLFDVHQAFGAYVAPLGRGLRIDFGKFVTPLGYEVIDGYDGVNDIATRSFLFGYAEPATHTGLRVGYALSDAVDVTGLLVQGWDVVKDDNAGKTVGVQLSLTPAPSFSAYVSYMAGPEQPGQSNLRHAVSLVATTNVGEKLTLACNVDAGREANVELEPTAGGGVVDASWVGVAGYATVVLTGRVSAALRAEWFDDPQGARTGYAQTLREVTLTPAVKFGRHVLIRGDIRRDWSDQHVFELSDGTFGHSQLTASVNAVLTF